MTHERDWAGEKGKDRELSQSQVKEVIIRLKRCRWPKTLTDKDTQTVNESRKDAPRRMSQGNAKRNDSAPPLLPSQNHPAHSATAPSSGRTRASRPPLSGARSAAARGAVRRFLTELNMLAGRPSSPTPWCSPG